MSGKREWLAQNKYCSPKGYHLHPLRGGNSFAVSSFVIVLNSCSRCSDHQIELSEASNV
jgi:hypothetical protein